MEFPFWALRVKAWGTSHVVILPTGLRQMLDIHEGDILAIRVHKPYATFAVWPMTKAVPIVDIPAKALPPLNAEGLRRA